jgi:antitoxin VapB
MALYIKDPQAEKLAGLLATMRHSNKTRMVVEALQEKYDREKQRASQPAEEESQRMLSLAHKLFSGPDLDTRSIDEIIGYDENGLPK